MIDDYIIQDLHHFIAWMEVPGYSYLSSVCPVLE